MAMNLANKSACTRSSYHDQYLPSVSDGRLHAATSIYSTWIILANTAYLTRISGMTVFRTDCTIHLVATPGCTVKCPCICTFRSLGIVLKCLDESVAEP